MIGRRDLFYFRARFTSAYSRLSSYFFFCSVALSNFCCFHARVFGKTLVPKFHFSYTHTEWYLLLSESATTRAHKRIWCEMAIGKSFGLYRVTSAFLKKLCAYCHGLFELAVTDIYSCYCSILTVRRCKNNFCIPVFKVCDGRSHCSDGSDEDPEFCKNKLGQRSLSNGETVADLKYYSFLYIYRS